MIKKLKTISLIIMTIISTYGLTGITRVSAATTDTNILKEGYGFKSINLAPRTKVNKNYSEKKGESTDYYFRYDVIDDKDKLKNYNEKGTYYPSKEEKKESEYFYCMVSGCTNKEHYHFTDYGGYGKEIVNSKNKDTLLRLQKGFGMHLDLDYVKHYKLKSACKTIVAADFSNLKSSTEMKVKYKNNKVSSVNRSMIVSYSCTNGKLNLILKDNSGIATGMASIKITDRNTGNVVANVNAKQLAEKLTNTTKNKDGKIIKGVYSINISNLLKNQNGTYSIKVDTVEATGLKGYDMAKFILATPEEIKKAEAQIPTSMEINREVRTIVDTSNKDKIKINFKDNAGISYLSLGIFAGDDDCIDWYTRETEKACNKSKTLKNKYITYKGYNKKTKMATLEINKSYFTEFSKSKNNELKLYIVTEDLSGLLASEQILIKPINNKWEVNRGTRTSVTYKNNIVYLTFKDNDGIVVDHFKLDIYDADDKIVNPEWETMTALLTNVKKNNNTIVEGTYALDISRLKKDNDGKYTIHVEAWDSTGNERSEEIRLKPIYSK